MKFLQDAWEPTEQTREQFSEFLFCLGDFYIFYVCNFPGQIQL